MSIPSRGEVLGQYVSFLSTSKLDTEPVVCRLLGLLCPREVQPTQYLAPLGHIFQHHLVCNQSSSDRD